MTRHLGGPQQADATKQLPKAGNPDRELFVAGAAAVNITSSHIKITKYHL
jgi:hypothetical protein